MNIIAVNGSPRKNWNTATLLQKALEGAEARRSLSICMSIAIGDA